MTRINVLLKVEQGKGKSKENTEEEEENKSDRS